MALFEGRYPAAVRAAARLSEEEAWRRILAKAPPLKPRALASLFGLAGLPRVPDRDTIPRA